MLELFLKGFAKCHLRISYLVAGPGPGHQTAEEWVRDRVSQLRLTTKDIRLFTVKHVVAVSVN